MRRLFSAVVFAALLGWPSAPAATAAAPTTSRSTAVQVCANAAPGEARCLALRNDARSTGRLAPDAAPAGYGPADLQAAYKLPSATRGSGQTIAIVDAYDDPKAESDLAVYRTKFHLSPCTTANGCFRKVNQSGIQGNYPRGNAGWAQEISLDVDMASAICPRCHILLVEANSPTFGNLGTAVNTAARLGADTISNSYGGNDQSDANFGHYYDHPGSAITVSSGDSGYGVSYPASSRYVTAVGGTSLRRAGSGRGWAETVWNGAGSGCSASNTKPLWQRPVGTGCAKRAVADVSAVADPATGVAVYDTYKSGGWLVFGGTSVSAPVIAGVYALAGNGSSVNYGSYPYAHAGSLFDVTAGTNGGCFPLQLCTARAGWDGPTGLGTPNGTAGF